MSYKNLTMCWFTFRFVYSIIFWPNLEWIKHFCGLGTPIPEIFFVAQNVKAVLLSYCAARAIEETTGENEEPERKARISVPITSGRKETEPRWEQQVWFSFCVNKNKKEKWSDQIDLAKNFVTSILSYSSCNSWIFGKITNLRTECKHCAFILQLLCY